MHRQVQGVFRRFKTAREFVTPMPVMAQRAGIVLRRTVISNMKGIVIAMEQGKQVASFNVGDSRCVLKDDQIRCAPVSK